MMIEFGITEAIRAIEDRLTAGYGPRDVAPRQPEAERWLKALRAFEADRRDDFTRRNPDQLDWPQFRPLLRYFRQDEGDIISYRYAGPIHLVIG